MIPLKRQAAGLTFLCALGAALAIAPTTRPLGTAAEAKPPAAADPGPGLVVHEWGTFLGMNGSDGTSLDGMYHEEHALPPFVHARSRDQLRIPSIFTKGETPVIYFYTDKPQAVQVAVGFPKGVWTQWYPQARRVVPTLAEQAQAAGKVGGGRICWNVDVIPRTMAEEALRRQSADAPRVPETSADALWTFARDVDAAYVRTQDVARTPAVPEYERFLFYRGLGEARLPVTIDAGAGGTLAVQADPTVADGIRDVFVLRVEDGRATYRHIPRLDPGASASGVIPSMDDARPVEEFTKAIADHLAARLAAAGLYEKEARAMVNTWTASYFKTEGIRALFVLPQTWTDAFIPMGITPRPEKLVRVMVGRLELLSKERERRAEVAVEGLTSPDATTREDAYRFLRDQGRYAEPIIRRVMRTTESEDVRLACRRLLTTELVTELRSAVHNAADGTPMAAGGLETRAQLARLLREIGQDQEAKAHGVAILNELEARRTKALLEVRLGEIANPPDEIRAAALEGSGVDRSAAAAYEACIRQRSASYRDKLDPANSAWFRDWWVGRGYAKSLRRAGSAEATAAALEASLAPGAPALGLADERTARMELAYLYAELGRADRVDALWASVQDRPSVAMQPDAPR
ncbi:hypothetical protein OJF2_58170 [Aquisphaera giovannonii]|uniref:HEAT repeat domain-containing protein n=1 Tax=Aquisphaera giovannonii TaxID=406548 RepID=A0A5B9WBH1_9BACT|nr:hypothetical protein [Aquisphaera giovannonii]QEH37230.1 hypothetical protein OJF2_58170 [Aquisphaera giovannonii]